MTIGKGIALGVIILCGVLIFIIAAGGLASLPWWALLVLFMLLGTAILIG